MADDFCMGTNTDTDIDGFLASVPGGFIVVAVLIFIVWLCIAILAAVVAPEDRPWSFFWCTLLLLGPLGIVLALVAPARPSEVRVSVVSDYRQG